MKYLHLPMKVTKALLLVMLTALTCQAQAGIRPGEIWPDMKGYRQKDHLLNNI